MSIEVCIFNIISAANLKVKKKMKRANAVLCGGVKFYDGILDGEWSRFFFYYCIKVYVSPAVRKYERIPKAEYAWKITYLILSRTSRIACSGQNKLMTNWSV